MGWQDGTVVAQGEANAAEITVPAWQRGKPVEAANEPIVPNTLKQHFQGVAARRAESFADYLQAGFQQSVGVPGTGVGLSGRGKMPDVAVDAETPWYGRQIAGAAGLLGDAPAMLAGALGTTLITGGRAPAPLIGAATFAVPAAVRAYLVDSYTKGDAQTAGEIAERATHVAWEGFKGGATGALTVMSGGAARSVLGAAAPTAAKVVLPTAAELVTMTTVSNALEGRLPNWQDFLDGGVLLFGLKAATAGAGRLATIYQKTGKTPAEVVADANSDPALKSELKAAVSEPPPAEGMVHVYRGESTAKAEIPEWVKQGMQESGVSDAQGRWWTTDPSIAQWYVDDAGSSGRMVYQDVPAKVADASRVSTLSEAIQRFSRDPENELFLPAEYVDKGRDVPRAYQPLAAEETARAIVPGDKAAQVAASPFAEIPQVKGEPALPTHVNYDLINSTEDAKLAMSRLSQVYESEIQTQRRGTVAWEETSNEAAAMLRDAVGDTSNALVMPREPGTAAGAAELLARKQMVVGAAESMMAARDELLAKGAEASESDKMAFLRSIERAAMIQSEFLGARAEAGRALNILKNTANDARRAQQAIDIISSVKKVPLSEQTAKFVRNTIFTEDRVLAARALLKSKIGTLNAGLDPETLGAGLTIAGAHIELGVRDFATFSKAMVADLGDAIKPYLRELFDKSMESIKRTTPEILTRKPDADATTDVMRMYGDPMQLATMLQGIDNPTAALKFARETAKATTWEKVVEGWKAAILSGPITTMANILGNGTFLAMRPAVDALAAIGGSLTGQKNRVSLVEPIARVIGDLQGAKDGLKLAWEVIKSGEEPGKAEQYRKAIGGVAGEIVRLPFRNLSAQDALFSTMNERGELYALATREAMEKGFNPLTREFRERVSMLVNNPPEEMAAAGKEAALRMTFNTPLGEFGRSVKDAIDAPWFGTKVSPMQMIVPFIRTPLNIMEEMFRFSPMAPFVGKWRADVAKGGAERAQALAEMAMGTAISAVVISYALDGHISGAGDPDPGKRRVKMAAGWQPYSINIGDKWYSYQRVQPLGTLMGMAADVTEVWDHMNDEEMDKIPKMVATAFANAVTNQTFLQGISTLAKAADDPGRFGPQLARQYAGSIVPSIIAQPASMRDPIAREVDSMLDAIKARIPGLRETLLPKRDIYGEPVANTERAGWILPITVKTESDDKVRTEAARIGFSAADTPKKTHIGRGTGKLGDVKLEPEERDVFAEKGGKMAHELLSTVVNDPSWDRLPDMVKLKVYRDVFTQAHKFAAYQALPLDKRIAKSTEISERMQIELQPEAAP